MIKKSLTNILEGDKFKSLLKRYKVKNIAIFGSYARGIEKRNSDIDFLIEFNKEADLLDQVGLKLDLEQLLNRSIDVVIPKSLSRYIRRQVLKEAVYLYE